MSNSAPRKAAQAIPEQAKAEQAKAEQADAEHVGDSEQADADHVGDATQAGAEPAVTPDARGDGKPDMDEVKRKFREALDRKREIHAESSAAGSRDPGKIHGAHGPAQSRRSFRRKSG